HLGDDEEQDPERLPVYPRALIGLRRMGVMLLGVVDGDGGGLHQAAPPTAAGSAGVAGSVPDSRCSSGLSVWAWTFSIRPSCSHLDCSPFKVEIRMSSIR